VPTAAAPSSLPSEKKVQCRMGALKPTSTAVHARVPRVACVGRTRACVGVWLCARASCGARACRSSTRPQSDAGLPHGEPR
jgi:hypothetical protein